MLSRIPVAVALGSTAAILALVLAAPGEATFPGENGVIAFTGQNDDIYTINADGSDYTQITSTANTVNPVFTPDGKTIIATSKGSHLAPRLVTVSVNGGKLHEIEGTTPAYSPTVSASGKRIAYVTDKGAAAIDINGKHKKGLLKGGVSSLSFSPTAPKLAVAADAGKSNQLFTMDANGKHFKQLVKLKNSDVSAPTWSPDGRTIVFALRKDGPADLWTISSDGSNLEQLTDTPDVDEDDPVYSPDGALIAYDTIDEIFTIEAGGSEPTQVTDDRHDDYYPDWQPLP